MIHEHSIAPPPPEGKDEIPQWIWFESQTNYRSLFTEMFMNFKSNWRMLEADKNEYEMKQGQPREYIHSNVLQQFRRFSEAMTTRWTRMRRYKRANKRERFGNLINYVIHFKRNDKMLMESKLFLFVFRLSSHCWSEHRTGGGGSCKEWISYHYSIYWR